MKNNIFRVAALCAALSATTLNANAGTTQCGGSQHVSHFAPCGPWGWFVAMCTSCCNLFSCAPSSTGSTSTVSVSVSAS